MKREDNQFFSIPDADPFLDMMFMSDRLPPYTTELDEQHPFDLNLFRSDELPGTATIPKQPSNTLQVADTRPSRSDNRMAIEEQEKQLQTKKKMKNTYESKMAKLKMNFGMQIQSAEEFPKPGAPPKLHTQQSVHDSSVSSEELKKDKLLKNRQSAKKSRRAKKQYMEQLEQHAKWLQTELEKAHKLNEKNAEYIKKYCNNESILNGYIVTKQQLFEKLQKLVESKSKAEEAQINTHIDSLRVRSFEIIQLRYGATGKQRITLIQYYFKQILDIMVPDVHKYMLFSAEKSCDIFSNPEKNPDDISELYKMLELPIKEKNRLSSIYRQVLLNERQTISNTLNQLFSVKEKLDRQIRRIQNLFDEIRKYIPPVGLAKFLICLEKNKYRKDVSRVWTYWEQVIQQQMDKTTQIIRKQVKKEGQI